MCRLSSEGTGAREREAQRYAEPSGGAAAPPCEELREPLFGGADAELGLEEVASRETETLQ